MTPKGEFTETDPLNIDSEPEKVEEKRSFKDTLALVGSNITIEPIMVIFVMSSILSALTTQNLNLEKACRVTLNFPDDVCLKLRLQDTAGLNSTYEEQVQRVVAAAVSWRSAIAATIPAFLALFVGSYSDRTGRRKLFLITPVIGELLQCISNMINVFFFDKLSLNFLVFTDAIFQALSGGWCIMFLTMFSYISAITDERNRTFRMGLVNFSLTVGFPIGMGISGILLKKTGYYGCFVPSASSRPPPVAHGPSECDKTIYLTRSHASIIPPIENI
ncbi:hypothetical protein EVAR_28648_1 [Eumeta japonica]|uniref:Solute carrier family 46 member 3 n=1 Tax=Eumeta variegata TaxID=151549 RepID=A0A4C1ZGZ4_EUMVA|nr:hypothetical protein EVAR_28648_1 [Eumeta japonica]